jgi:hypothetical protein
MSMTASGADRAPRNAGSPALSAPPARAPKYPRLDRNGHQALLARIVARATHDPANASGKAAPVVVFDLDGTLFDNRPRSHAILQELAAEWEARHPEHASRLGRLRPEEMAYLLSDSLARVGLTDAERVAEATEFWKARFFADDHLRHDVPVAGAPAFAKACYDAGAVLVYLTGRDLPLMGIGSFRSLRDHGFPIGVPGTELVLKPDAAMPDEEFKRVEMPKLARVGTIVAAFDNEPVNCNTVLAQNPGCESVLLDTQHLPGAPPLDAGVHVIADFRLA